MRIKGILQLMAFVATLTMALGISFACAVAADADNPREDSVFHDVPNTSRRQISLSEIARLQPVRDYADIESVCGDDDRTQVLPESGPERATCLLYIKFPGVPYWYEGTGFIVASNLVLTAGHCVYNRSLGVWAEQVLVAPGAHNYSDAPFGRYHADRLYTVRGWKNDSLDDYDYGAVVVSDESMHKKVGYVFGLVAQSDEALLADLFYLQGYPSGRGGTQWISLPKLPAVEGTVTSFRFGYDLDTSRGQSGSPVIPKSNTNGVAGIHTTPGCPNGATRITSYRRHKILSEWAASR